MRLLSLPSEILVLIFDFIPTSCFYRDPSILYISKAWYTYAHAASLQHLRLTSKSLPRFPPEDEDLSDFIQDHTTSLSLKLYGLIDHTTPIKAQLDDLASTVAKLRQLRKFEFMACYCSTPWEALYSSYGIDDDDRLPLDYLWAESVHALMLSLPHTVTTLKLDTIGSTLMTGREGSRLDIRPRRLWHICKMFKQMASLRVLKVRMDVVCGKVFQGPHVKKITVSLRNADKDGKKMMRVCAGCDEQERPAGDSLEQRLLWAGREAVVLVGTARTKECVILGQRKNGDLYEIDCGTGIVKDYSAKNGRAWGIRSDDCEYVVGKSY